MEKDLKIFTDNIEQKALEEINTLLEQEAFKNCKVRIMPDVHAGMGCVIGFTADLGDKIIPNVVGVDIGCGMLTVMLRNIDIDLEKLDKVIRNYVPSGFEVHEEQRYKFLELEKLRCLTKLRDTLRIERSIGTLGGGNHFIEVDVDEEGNKYLVIHTGSRNLGKQVADIYQELAIKHCSYEDVAKEEKRIVINELKKLCKETEIQNKITEITEKYKGLTKLPKDLCYLEGKGKEDYLHDMKICQEFAKDNRLSIAKQILCNYFEVPYYKGYESVRLREEARPNTFETQDMIMYDFRYFETVHNYINFEDNITRKGAISAQKGEKVLIPINMRDGCIIAVGKGNEYWNCSAPHGAGRIMSRTKAKEVVKLEEFQKTMEGIYSTSVNEETLDEAPMVYKPIEEIINNIGDTVDMLKVIKPIYNFKASEVK